MCFLYFLRVDAYISQIIVSNLSPFTLARLKNTTSRFVRNAIGQTLRSMAPVFRTMSLPDLTTGTTSSSEDVSGSSSTTPVPNTPESLEQARSPVSAPSSTGGALPRWDSIAGLEATTKRQSRDLSVLEKQIAAMIKEADANYERLRSPPASSSASSASSSPKPEQIQNELTNRTVPTLTLPPVQRRHGRQAAINARERIRYVQAYETQPTSMVRAINPRNDIPLQQNAMSTVRRVTDALSVSDLQGPGSRRGSSSSSSVSSSVARAPSSNERMRSDVAPIQQQQRSNDSDLRMAGPVVRGEKRLASSSVMSTEPPRNRQNRRDFPVSSTLATIPETQERVRAPSSNRSRQSSTLDSIYETVEPYTGGTKRAATDSLRSIEPARKMQVRRPSLPPPNSSSSSSFSPTESETSPIRVEDIQFLVNKERIRRSVRDLVQQVESDTPPTAPHVANAERSGPRRRRNADQQLMDNNAQAQTVLPTRTRSRMPQTPPSSPVTSSPSTPATPRRQRRNADQQLLEQNRTDEVVRSARTRARRDANQQRTRRRNAEAQLLDENAANPMLRPRNRRRRLQ